ncbi:MAG: hypothetical protein A3J54_03240 [Candidatus Ryanbacteria bacterium RIFCSPHIGHO2_02_FULL_45_13b]|uniref:DNA polymerase III subunit delta n=1 Tax=Candidatus Ryanbacteria bacterium RIFCSPHIGHO2_02_FULL_45_13b TaxID=1802117 RepID=A0A1G2G4P9_9BACT|nr:MAG: hypothetical protein A3J54_03240 [Candidatus Ryanbacteria bacterium RIFCSPHIGHO2_02_FULL_45_13b]
MIGHKRQQALLDLHMRSGAMSHAYLFSGARHVGKMTFAKMVAVALLCEKREAGKGMLFSCGTCRACVMTKAGSHPDMVVVDAEQSGETALHLEDIQRVRERAALSAYGGMCVFIIRDISRITREAANAFLKVLEEPRGRVVFLLLAGVADDVLPTIRSRVWHMRFWPMSEEILTVGIKKEYDVPSEQVAQVVRLSGGLPGVAFRLVTSLDEQKLLEKEHMCIRTLFDASIAKRMKYAEKLRENPEGMQKWFTESIAILADRVHVSLSQNNHEAIVAADQCKMLMEHEEQFLKPYGVKRILFEDALIGM